MPGLNKRTLGRMVNLHTHTSFSYPNAIAEAKSWETVSPQSDIGTHPSATTHNPESTGRRTLNQFENVDLVNLPELPTEELARKYLFEIQQKRHELRAHQPLSLSRTVWPAGLNRRFLRNLPLSVKTRNCLDAAVLYEGNDALTAGEILSLPNFGVSSLQELLFSVERFLNECVLAYQTEKHEKNRDDNESQNYMASVISELPHKNWVQINEAISSVLASAREIYDIRTLDELLSPQLLNLARKMGLVDKLHQIQIDEIEGSTFGIITKCMSKADELINTSTCGELLILRHRILPATPETLESIASSARVSRQRIHQIEVNLKLKIKDALNEEVSVIAKLLREEFGNIANESDVNFRIANLYPENSRNGIYP